MNTTRSVRIWKHSLKLTANTPENRPFDPKGNEKVCQPSFSGVFAVSFREGKDSLSGQRWWKVLVDWFQKVSRIASNPWIIHNMLRTIPGSVLPFLSMCPTYIYLYLLEGANASNSIKTNFHFTAKPVLYTFLASILSLSEMANGDVPVQVAADGEKTSQLMSTHNSKLKFIRKLLQMFLLFWDFFCCFVQLETCRSCHASSTCSVAFVGFSGVYDGPLATIPCVFFGCFHLAAMMGFFPATGWEGALRICPWHW